MREDEEERRKVRGRRLDEEKKIKRKKRKRRNTQREFGWSLQGKNREGSVEEQQGELGYLENKEGERVKRRSKGEFPSGNSIKTETERDGGCHRRYSWVHVSYVRSRRRLYGIGFEILH